MFYDFHIHTCLTATAADDMTPSAIVKTAAQRGLGVIGVADYNSCSNCRAAVIAGKSAGVVVIPGMELITSEGIHTLCLFPDVESAEACAREIQYSMPALRHEPAAHGHQYIVSAAGTVLGEEERYLELPSAVSFREVPGLAMRYGGIGGFAHLDRDPGSALSVLEKIDPYMSYVMANVTNQADPAEYVKRFPFLSIYTNSDAFSLDDISQTSKNNILEASFSNSETFIRFLRELPI